MYCSPSHHKYSNKGTCFSPEDIEIIKKDLSNKEQVEISDKRPKGDIKKHFYQKCGDKEYCWLDQLSYETRKKLEHAFRPKKPREWSSNPRTWLNTDDIHYVMVQYEHLHKDFKFLGVHPMDFAKTLDGGYCVSSNNLCQFDIKNYPNHNRFALVLNLDYHNQPGSHWVALYFNVNPKLRNFGIYFYDSTAPSLDEINDEVFDFMARIKSQIIRDQPTFLAKKFQTEINTVQRQFKNTECGMFCLVFLTQCVKNIPFKRICQRMKTDDEVNKIRNILYRPSK